MKKILIMFIAVIMICSISITSFGSPGTWHADGYGWWYLNADGSYPVNSWEEIDGGWYHFDYSGYMQTGWINDGGTWYYLAPSGVMQTGWVFDSGYWYYMNPDGAMATGWVYDGGNWYYMNEYGVMQTGTHIINGESYYFDANGVWIYDSYYEEPSYSVTMSNETNSSTLVTGMMITNNGSGTMRIYSDNAWLEDNDYSIFNRTLRLFDTYALDYYNVLSYLSYIDIPPYSTGNVFFVVDGNSTWYDEKSRIYFDFSYNGVLYQGNSSAYYGSFYNKYY